MRDPLIYSWVGRSRSPIHLRPPAIKRREWRRWDALIRLSHPTFASLRRIQSPNPMLCV
jgi:hypothetical protein